MRQQIEIYQTAEDCPQVEVTFAGETVWLTQNQMVTLFDHDQSVISRHIRNAINGQEVSAKSNMQKMHIANSDKPVALYDLDVVISVGYRIKSAQGVAFRRWATQRLKEYLVKGYAINHQRFEQNAAELQKALHQQHRACRSNLISGRVKAIPKKHFNSPDHAYAG